jgi:hypothetical protein
MGSYAVTWNGTDGAPCAGRLDLDSRAANLRGASKGQRADETVAFGEIDRIAVERGRLHIVRRVGRALAITSLDGPGALRELADLLAAAI